MMSKGKILLIIAALVALGSVWCIYSKTKAAKAAKEQ
ncbi:hypothetical protein Halhy_5911 [Haliscomenobacter hydrossis DSM 1100]|uniref:Uncharacterized protein n=1 Tax=Haliscomenobacter hydrossis (strain ATCC 27775 / DSM 1100 / LMG 10767 / O) TaxID=760192 RepID=F4KZ80_HALH1|nr:hypothetical protein Halhy_5911 [Haliscomenobacter hydrossis DSM 1100]